MKTLASGYARGAVVLGAKAGWLRQGRRVLVAHRRPVRGERRAAPRQRRRDASLLHLGRRGLLGGQLRAQGVGLSQEAGQHMRVSPGGWMDEIRARARANPVDSPGA